MTMTAVMGRVTGYMVVGKVIDSAEYILLIRRVLVGVEVTSYAFNLVEPSRAGPLLAAETKCSPTGRECVLSITHVLGENRCTSTPKRGLHPKDFIDVSLTSQTRPNEGCSVGATTVPVNGDTNTMRGCSDFIVHLLCFVIVEYTNVSDAVDMSGLLRDLIYALRPGFKACATKAPDLGFGISFWRKKKTHHKTQQKLSCKPQVLPPLLQSSRDVG